ncbi:MAG TPA: 5-oxoprolinase subunit PxpB [Candidatus Methylomirabilis sp.]|nr:5-oxoprolinase subunit PxpB [Candidatus Methylomirabilis sp.]
MPRFLPAGDAALTVEFGNRIALPLNRKVRALALAMEKAALPGVIEVVPTYRSLTIYYDPLSFSLTDLRLKVEDLLERLEEIPLPASRLVTIPTVYGGEYGPDLAFVAQHCGLTEEAVIRLHTRPTYHVYMLGFTAGYAYLGGMPKRLTTPRLPSPRLRVPAGSVGIGGNQTGVYPVESPGGWRLIGRTPLTLFDPSWEVPVLIQPGDQVKFVRIAPDEFEARRERARRGESDG